MTIVLRPRLRFSVSFAVWAALLIALGCSPPPPTPLEELFSSPTAGRDIIVVLSDTHRLDHVDGLDEGAPGFTPELEAFVTGGLAFTGALTTVPISAPAYATLMTGLLPREHGLLNNEQDLDGDLPLLQERLRKAGYRTAAVIGNPYCSGGHGFARGFDEFWDAIEGRGNHGEVITEEAIRLLEKMDEKAPIFLFLAYMDAHTPYITDEIPPSMRVELNGERQTDLQAENAHIEQRIPLRLVSGRNLVTLRFLEDESPAAAVPGESPLHVRDLRLASGRRIDAVNGLTTIPGTGFQRLANRAELAIVNRGPSVAEDELVFRCFRRYRHENIPRFYGAGVRGFDRSFGRLVAELQSQGRWDDSVVVFVSDHGEMLGEHDAWGHVEHLHQESLLIPLVIKAPGIEGGRIEHRRFGLRDLHDLILDLALGPDPARQAAIDRRRQVPFIAATYPPEGGRLQVAVIDGSRKVAIDEDGARSAFDLDADPGELDDLLTTDQVDKRFDELFAVADAELESLSLVDTLDLETLSEEDRDRLRALGYLHHSP